MTYDKNTKYVITHVIKSKSLKETSWLLERLSKSLNGICLHLLFIPFKSTLFSHGIS